jgi:hypothetical protein
MGQSPVGKDVSMEAKESKLLTANTMQQVMKM